MPIFDSNTSGDSPFIQLPAIILNKRIVGTYCQGIVDRIIVILRYSPNWERDSNRLLKRQIMMWPDENSGFVT